MAEQLMDARMEGLLRQAFVAEVARLPLTVTPEQVLRRRAAGAANRGRGWRAIFRGQSGQGLLQLAGAALVVVFGAVALGLFVNNANIGPRPSPSSTPTQSAGPSDSATPGVTQSPSPAPTADTTGGLGVFAPIAGRILYSEDSLWAADQTADDPESTLVRFDLEGTGGRLTSFTLPLGWSSDGTKLLFLRRDPADRTFPYSRYAYVLEANGTETRVQTQSVEDAAISPDGSTVAFVPDGAGVYVVDIQGGEPVRIAAEGASPSFSPDGAQVAYVASSGTVWIVNADGTNAHEILADEPSLVGGVFDVAWSPAGDRIAMTSTDGNNQAIYTSAPDGSGLKVVIADGSGPQWSSDGSHIAFTAGPGLGLSVANADGSNVRHFGFGGSGPWHPGSSAATVATPSPASGLANFTSVIHGMTIDYPSNWQVRAATETWDGSELSFDSAAADVIYDPAHRDGLYIELASQPYGTNTGDSWRDAVASWSCATGAHEAWGWTVDGFHSDQFGPCNSGSLIQTADRGYFIRVVAEPSLAATYNWDWLRPLLDTVDLRPEDAR